MKLSRVCILVPILISFFVSGVIAQSASRGVDWTQPATTLLILNAQILDWQNEFEALASQPTSSETLQAILTLNFQKGPIVVEGMKALQDGWLNHSSDSEKKTRYLAVSHYFATHSVDLGDSLAWEWYRCFSPPLSPRYNFLAEEAEMAGAPIRAGDEKLLAGLTSDAKKALFQLCRPAITDFISQNNYPFTEDSISKMTFDGQGIFLSGRYPKNKAQLSPDFIMSGSVTYLFGMGL